MTLANHIFRTCPSCSKVVIQSTLVSGNTLGAAFWTDGKLDAPGLPHFPRMVRCPHCHILFWLPDAPDAEEDQLVAIPHWIDPDIKYPDDPNQNDYVEALATGLAHDTAKEIYLRVGAWYTANDLLRHNALVDVADVITESMAANMQALYHLLNPEELNGCLMMAEIHRELGHFDQALHLLSTTTFNKKHMPHVNAIQALASDGVRRVMEVKPD